MDSYNIIIAPYAWEQLNNFIDYIQYTLLNEQAAKSVYEDALETIDALKNVAGSLQYCQNKQLRERGYRIINFMHHQYLMLYFVNNRDVYIEAIYHQQQDYENTFINTL